MRIRADHRCLLGARPNRTYTTGKVDTADHNLNRLRRDLLDCYRAALEAVDGRRSVRAALQETSTPSKVQLIAIGKAAASMCAGALDAWDGCIERGLIISKAGYLQSRLLRNRRFTCIESQHPVPDRRSLQAGRALLDFLAQAPPQTELLFLISGGASSLVEVPAAGVTLSDVIRVNRWLLGSGLDIAGMNAVRQGLSGIKGGRLGAHLDGRHTRALLISDVEGDDPAIIGSGLLVAADPTRWRQLHLPDWLTALLDGAAGTAPPPTEATVQIVATLTRAKAAAARRGAELGYPVVQVEAFQRGDACAAGHRLARDLCAAPPGLYVWGGETTVRLPPRPGRGGRCQTLGLCAAQRLHNCTDAALLAAGTDGADGPGEDAGALVDGETLRRGMEAGFDAEACLAAADAGAYLEAAGDLIQTGPTGTNVTDLILGARAG